MIAFCKGIRRRPGGSFATPLPWDMPGYDDQVIMAAGAFVQGSSVSSPPTALSGSLRRILQNGPDLSTTPSWAFS